MGALVITGKRGQSIHIGDEISIAILDMGRNRVSLGITAPRHLGVSRQKSRPMTLTLGAPAAGSTTANGGPR